MPTQKKKWSSSATSKGRKNVFQERKNAEDPGIDKKSISDDELRSLLIDFYSKPYPDGWNKPKFSAFLQERGLGDKWEKFSTHWNKSGLGKARHDNEDLSFAIEKYNKWKANEKSKLADRNRANARKSAFVIKEDPPDPSEALKTLVEESAMERESVALPEVCATSVVSHEVPSSEVAKEASIDPLQHRERSSNNEIIAPRASKKPESEMKALIMAFYTLPGVNNNIAEFLTTNEIQQLKRISQTLEK